MQQFVRGTTRQRISRKNLGTLKVVVPELAQQVEITSALERLGSNRRSASDHVSAARRAVERFRQAVLAAACSGRLTADWRTGRGVVDDELPGGWQRCRLGELAASISSHSTDFPILRSSSVRPFVVDYTDVRYLSPSQSTREQNYLRDGDLLITRLSGSLEYVGNCAVVRSLGGRRIQYPDRLFCCRLSDIRESNFIEVAFGGPEIRSQVEAASRSAAGHQRISISDLKAFQIVRPPLDEQREIVRRVKHLLQLADAIRSRVDAASTRINRSSPAILAKAFRGELVGIGDAS
jgi:type I restriction enzyme S subunit